MIGTIKRYYSSRAFGFIICEDKKEIFFHKNAVVSGLDEGEEPQAGWEVSFEEGVDRSNRRCCRNLKILNKI